MTVISIPKRIAKEELVIIPRRVYDALKKATSVHIVKNKKLPRGVVEGLKDYKAGRTSGPFGSVGALMRHLEK